MVLRSKKGLPLERKASIGSLGNSCIVPSLSATYFSSYQYSWSSSKSYFSLRYNKSVIHSYHSGAFFLYSCCSNRGKNIMWNLLSLSQKSLNSFIPLAVVSIVTSACSAAGNVALSISLNLSMNAHSDIWQSVSVPDLLSRVTFIVLFNSGKYSSFLLLYFGLGLRHSLQSFSLTISGIWSNVYFSLLNISCSLSCLCATIFTVTLLFIIALSSLSIVLYVVNHICLAFNNFNHTLPSFSLSLFSISNNLFCQVFNLKVTCFPHLSIIL